MLRHYTIWCCLLLAVLGTNAIADEVPRWEIGAGVGVLHAPDYRGADEGRTYALPLPFVLYHSDVFNVDREGARGRLAHSGVAQLDLSVAAAIPVNSKDNQARTGMPNLDPAFEIGPALDVLLREDAEGRRSWSFRAPLRWVVATDLRHAEPIGWVFAPYLDYRVVRLAGHWETDVAAGPLFASKGFHDYYYQVAPEFATPTRPAYEAPAGYSGSRVTFVASRRYGNIWLGLFGRYDVLTGAVFANSPLVKQHDSLMVGAGVAYIFARSSETVSQ